MPEQQDTLGFMAWNIQAGGFRTHRPTLAVPVREAKIKDVVEDFHADYADIGSAVSLSDAYRWDTYYGDDEAIARHLGYPTARFVPLDDDRLKTAGEDGIGIVFATDRHVQASDPLDLETRQGLRTVLDVGKYGLQVASVYLDDYSEDTRVRQLWALSEGLEKDIPTVLLGDFNLLRRDMRGSSMGVRAGDLAVRSLAFILPSSLHIGATIKGMNDRRAISVLEALGYTDADNGRKRPTAPSILPIFGIDYVFHNDQVAVDGLEIPPVRRQSDHRPLIFTATAP